MASCSVPHGETPTKMKWVLQFVDHRNCKILHRNPAVAGRINQQLVLPESELSGALTWLHLGGWREKRPFKIRLIA